MKLKEIITLLEEEELAKCGHPMQKQSWLSSKPEDMDNQFKKCDVCGLVWMVNVPKYNSKTFDSNPVNKGMGT